MVTLSAAMTTGDLPLHYKVRGQGLAQHRVHVESLCKQWRTIGLALSCSGRVQPASQFPCFWCQYFTTEFPLFVSFSGFLLQLISRTQKKMCRALILLAAPVIIRDGWRPHISFVVTFVVQ